MCQTRTVTRDQAIFTAWLDGTRQRDIAAQHQATQPLVSRAIRRHIERLTDSERATIRGRLQDRLDNLSDDLAVSRNGQIPALARSLLLVATRIERLSTSPDPSQSLPPQHSEVGKPRPALPGGRTSHAYVRGEDRGREQDLDPAPDEFDVEI